MKEALRLKVEELKARRKILSTWDIIKEKDFHLNADYLVIDRDLLLEVIEACNVILTPKDDSKS